MIRTYDELIVYECVADNSEIDLKKDIPSQITSGAFFIRVCPKTGKKGEDRDIIHSVPAKEMARDVAKEYGIIRE